MKPETKAAIWLASIAIVVTTFVSIWGIKGLAVLVLGGLLCLLFFILICLIWSSAVTMCGGDLDHDEVREILRDSLENLYEVIKCKLLK